MLPILLPPPIEIGDHRAEEIIRREGINQPLVEDGNYFGEHDGHLPRHRNPVKEHITQRNRTSQQDFISTL